MHAGEDPGIPTAIILVNCGGKCGSYSQFLSHVLPNRCGRLARFILLLKLDQRSVLGPVLFNLTTRDIWRDISSKIIAYADDTTTITTPLNKKRVASCLVNLNKNSCLVHETGHETKSC